MASKGDIRAAIDNSRLTTRLSIIGGITSLILLVLTLVLGAVKGELVGADVFSLAVIPYSLALLFSISALIYGMLGTSAAIENEETDEAGNDMIMQRTCPKCGKTHDIDYPKCPDCGYNYLEHRN